MEMHLHLSLSLFVCLCISVGHVYAFLLFAYPILILLIVVIVCLFFSASRSFIYTFHLLKIAAILHRRIPFPPSLAAPSLNASLHELLHLILHSR